MSVKISAALSAEGVCGYFREEYAANYSSYYSESGRASGVWFGKECAPLGLEAGAPVQEGPFRRLAFGQHPQTGEQLIQWQKASEEKAPKWAKDQDAWRNHLESLLGSASQDGREVFREHAGGERLVKQSAQLEKKASLPAERSDREKALLEMHAIARDTFAENLAGEAGGGAQKYLKDRGIKPATYKAFGVGLADGSGKQLVEKLQDYGPELMEASGLFVHRGDEFVDRFRGRLMFPIENAASETIAFAGRKPPGEDNGPKYVNSPETEIYRKGEELFNLHRAADRIAETGQVVVVEGYLDAIAAYQAGQRNVVAASGTAITEAQVRTLAERAKTAILNLDGDEAGRRATEKHVEALLDAGMNVRALELPNDPAAWIQEYGAKEYRKQVREVPPLVSYLADQARRRFHLEDVYGRVDAMHWMMSRLEHVQPEHREQIVSELEAHLQVPRVQPEEAEKVSLGMEHRAAWDITFSAPKTVSLTALVGSDERVVMVHDRAVREGLGYFERAIQVKMGGLNAPQTTGRLVSALFRHDTARPVDGYPAPQLHTHAVVFNMSQDRDGQYRALNPKELFYLQAAAEAVYQNQLAVGLKALGYQLEYGKNLAIEVKGYSKEYREAESQRTAEIEKEKQRLGMFGPGADSNIAQNTREAKLDLTPEDVRALHLQHAAQFGDQPQRVVDQARENKRVAYSPEYRAELAEEAIAFAKARLSERTTVMEWHEIHRDALRFGRGYITLPDVEQAFARARERGEFKGVSHWRNYAPESRWTTPELEAKEREILGWMANGRGRVGAIAGQITRDEFRAQFRDHLNDGQKWLVWKLIHAEDRMVGVQGLAGSGKTRALATVQDFAQRYGYEVRGVAATSGAVGELRKVGIDANTLAGFVLSREKQLRPRTYLLDEASLTDVHQMSDFLRKLTPADRVIVIGDTRQHASLGAGRIFAELQEAGMQTFQLRKIVRQKPKDYREVVKDLSRGQIIEALTKLESQDRIHAYPNERARYGAIAAWYSRDPERTLVVSPDNRSRMAIADAIRSRRREMGQLGEEVYRARVLNARNGLTKEDLRFAGSYQVGDVVVFAMAGPKKGIVKGDLVSVLSVDRDKNLVTVMREKDGKVFDYDPKRFGVGASVYEPTYREFSVGDRVQFTKSLKSEGIANRSLGTLESIDETGKAAVRSDSGHIWRGNLEQMPHLDHGYAMTSYSAQGSTAMKVIVHLDTDAPGVSRMISQQLIYVAASRGREDVQVFANSREELSQALLRREENATALAPEQISRYQKIAV